MSFFDELKRRKVFRVAAGYTVAAWVLAQVADLVTDAFNSPDWVMQMIITLLVIGLPVSLLLSWAFDLTSDGLRRTESGVDEGTLVVSNKAMLALAAGLFLVIGLSLVLLWPRGDQSIAVLPFEDVSPGGDQAYLGTGIADELRLELQGLDGLRVAGRTSSNAYATEDSKTIGDMLNVDSILEGSVRKEGDRLRVTVQLTNVSDGFTIWSQPFDLELNQIFEMQRVIAASVAGYLGVSLGVGSANAFKGAGTNNIEAYDAYLEARSLRNDADGRRIAIPLLERATRLDPNYGVAYSILAIKFLNEQWDATADEAPKYAERAHQLAARGAEASPESANAQSVLAILRMYQRDWIGSEQAHGSAINLLADRETVARYAVTLLRSGRVSDAKEQFRLAESLEPMGGRPAGLSWHASLAQGLVDEARDIRMRNMGTDFFEDNLDLAVNEDDPAALQAAIQELPETNAAFINLYTPLLAARESPDRVLTLLQNLYENSEIQWPRKLHDIAMAAAYFGHPRLALRVKKTDIDTNPSRTAAIWYPVMSEVRQLEEFKDFVREMNLVEYWRTYGWADACRPLSDSDFTCT